jgi:YVTN family beta-propeller protein
VASVTNAVNPRFKWLFGDGAPETAYSTDPIISHSFAQPGIYVLRLTVIDDSNTEKSITFNQAVHLALTANRPATSMNIVYEQRSTGNSRIWAVNPDNDTVSVFDAVTNDKLAEIAVGLMPRSLAVAPNGHVWVTNKGAATLSLINVNTLNVAQTVNLPYGSQPFGVVFAPDGSAAYITLEASGQVLKLNVNDGALLGSVNVGPNPRHLAVSADGGALLVARFITPRLPGEETASVQTEVGGVQVGGEVVVVNTAAMSVAQTIVLQHSNKNDTEVQGRGFPNYLAVPAISPDGTSAWVPSKQDNLRRGALRDGNNLNFQNTVRAISSRIDLASGVEDLNSRIDHDNAGVASAGLFDHFGVYLFVALETSREVAVVDVHGHRELFRINVGRAPQGLALSPDGLRLYVHNFMDRTISVLDITNLINQGDQNAPTLATLQAVASESLTPQVLLGKQLFYDAKDPRLALDSYISCAACHNDGAHDGRVWDITGMGEGLRNTINLRGRGGMGQGFLHWSGNFDEVQDFEGQIRALSGGTGLLSASDFAATQDPLGAAKTGLSADLDALAAYVASLNSFAVSPKRNADGSLTVDAQAGKTIFTNANCAQCHGGAGFTLSGAANLQNIGTIRPSSGSRLGGPLTGIDTPTLRDVWATAPYLHDGSAATLANAVSAHSGVSLGATDLVQLVAYLEQIDANEQAPVNPPPTVNLTSPTNGASFNSGSTISLAADASDANGTVTQVEFYDGATLLNIDTSSPYSFDWAGGGIGSHSLTAKAYDNLGASTTSAAVNITVNAVGNGLLGSYFANVSLSGSPVLQRVEVVNFNWGSAAPAANVPADNFSVRWTGRVLAPTTGTYYFRTVSDDGVRLWVNGTRRINNWNNHSSTTNTSKAVTLTGGQYYTIKLEYYENTGSAVIQLLWRTPGTSTYVVIPQSQLAPQ